MKKFLSLVLTLALALSLMTFSAQAAAPDFIANVGSQPETLDPQMNSASDGSVYIHHLFEGLMNYDWDGNGIVPGAAESYEMSEDGLTWTFKIRDDAKWSDGQDLVAEDFVYSFKRLANPDTGAPYAGDMSKFILNGLDVVQGDKPVDELGVTALDSKTLEVKLQNPCSFFEMVMAFPAFYPVRADVVEGNNAWATSPETLIGNGGYLMESWTMDEEIVMVPNPTYYNVENIVCQRLVFKLIADPMAKITAVRSGELDFADDLPSDQIEAAKAEGIYFIMPIVGTYYVNFNNTKAPFDNVLVRKAFTLAIDTEVLARIATGESYLPADNFVGPGYPNGTPGSDFHDAQVVIDRSDYEANKKLAQEALAEAGYPNGEGFPVVEYWTNVAGVHQPTAEMLISMWKEVLGVTVEVQGVEWNVFLEARRTKQHAMARDGWVADVMDASNLLGLFESYSGNNSTGYNNPEYDALMKAYYQELDPVKAAEFMHQAEMLAFGQDYASCPVYYYPVQTISRPGVEGVALFSTNDKLFFKAVAPDR